MLKVANPREPETKVSPPTCHLMVYRQADEDLDSHLAARSYGIVKAVNDIQPAHTASRSFEV